MRFVARHKKRITVIIGVLAIIGFVYLTIQTINRKDVDADSKSYSGEAMGTVVKKTIFAENVEQSEYADGVIDDCLTEIENRISIRVEDSEVSKCNRNYAVDGTYELSDWVLNYIKEELKIYQETEGAFSPCVRPVAALWGIEEGYSKIPMQDEVENVLSLINADNIEVTDEGIVFHEDGMMIDFGATGKGIACDEVAKILAETEVQGAVVSIGGSILLYGDKGNGKDWHVGIQNPRADEGEVMAVVDLPGGKVVSTSGDYEKYFEVDGKRYHHIFDPATGYPANSGLISVTIISDSGFLSDAMSTACFVMGLEKGMQYAEEKGVEAIFVTEEKEVYVTNGIKKDIQMKADDYKICKMD